MTRVHTSSGVKVALGWSLLDRFRQYLQSKIHSLVNKIFNREMQRPSEEKLWQIPEETAFPRYPFFPRRLEPLDVQATSYLAASARIFNFSCRVILQAAVSVGQNLRTYVGYMISQIEHMYN